MATKPLKTLTFEGLDDTYTVPQIDNTLSVTGKAADAKVTGDSLAEKASASGMVDMAKSLVGGKYTSDKQPYHFRKSPSGGAKDEVIVGGSLGWNQLCYSDRTFTLNRDTTRTHNVSTYGRIATQDHVYCLFCNITRATVDTANLLFQWGGFKATFSSGIGQKVYINRAGVNTLDYIYAYMASEEPSGTELDVEDFSAIDLTTCFGSTIADYIYSLEQSSAGAGVAWVKQYIDLDTYHPYDAGSIQSVEGLVSHDTVGFNQWDEEWEHGSIDSNGQNTPYSANMRSTNYIPVLPNTAYYRVPLSRIVSFWYDENKNFISMNATSDIAVTSPQNAHYMRFRTTDSYGGTYKNDICINLSDPSRNGTYEPYEKHSYPLDSDVVLRGVPKLVTDHLEFDGDKYRSDGTVERRYGVVDLGTLNWIAVSGYTGLFQATLTGVKPCLNQNIGNALCSKYVVVSGNNLANVDKSIVAGMNNNNYVMVRDTAYTDATAFKAAMSGVYLVYELATPTTETAQPFQSPMFVGQTEEYVSESVVPVGHESKYYEDVAKKVSGLPKDFSTLIAPVEVTFTATRNYSVGSYLIVKNQLYKVTSAISSGGTITPNSNVTATTIMAEIMTLQ